MKANTDPNFDAYQFTVRPLSKDQGGGYLVEYPDIPDACPMAKPLRRRPQMGARLFAIALRSSREAK
jgi:hypothetical protein